MSDTTTRNEPADRVTGPIVLGTLAGVLALGLSVSALIVATDDSDAASTGVDAAASSAHVVLSEFAIDPGTVTVATGGSLHVVNEGAVAHNLSVADQDLATPDLLTGETGELDLAGLEPGSYELACLVPGHADAGMTAELDVVDASGASGHASPGHATSHDDMDYAAMTEAMVSTMSQYPAGTDGAGNPALEPTEVLPDGTNVFDLVAEIVPWERAPGDVVDAWTYNGVVPAPTIHLEIGDRAQFRLRNELPIATDLHLHGLNVENGFDGVAPLTQPLIEPGETFTYDYVADEVSVAMYHPHFHSQIGLPNGMFGTIFVGQVPIPRGETIGGESIPADLTVAQEFPMVLNDAGVIGYSLNGKSFPATAPVVAADGDWILFHYFNEGTQVHPMHLHQFDQIVIAMDGYTLDAPYVADTVLVGPGERYSVLVQLDKAGTWVWHCHILPHVEGEQGMFGMVTAVVVQ